MENTNYLSLPYITGSQDQKHITHNEALRILDAVVQLSVIDRNLTTPPADPSEGVRYIVASGANGAWAGWEKSIAAFLDGGWTRLVPNVGWFAWVEDESAICVFNGTDWVLFSDFVTGGGVSLWGVNTAADETNRLAIKSDAVLISHDDVTPGTGNIQVKLNKSATANTGSFLFQTDWSGRAEMGLAGEDNFSFKVSPDGASWQNGLRIAAASGVVSFPSGVDNLKPKNWIINGGFTVNQRGGTRTPGVGVYGFDRWKGHAGGLEQVIAGLPAGDYTLTFESASNGAGTIGGTTAPSPIYVTGLAGGATSVVVPADATRVSVCSGDCRSMVDPFEDRNDLEELAMCQRYFEFMTVALIQSPNSAAGLFGSYITFGSVKRISPTVSFVNVLESNNVGAVVASPISPVGFRLYTSALVVGDAYYTAVVQIDAEI
ncbi:DUF2793 domain-containing protein [Cohaesibacter sp. ES.047]|uniref:DUF2793 domain-containing protein n=1 Tax=Cohaesibacter sp. ES.047 TaxID=1798205 RepID=UPI0012FDED0A|nr:DUF2793 domain-containing protein [Cohaesibacter sp. ES.047]